MRVNRGSAVAVLVIGGIVIGLAVAGSRWGAAGRLETEREVAELRAQLDSVRGTLRSATTAGDSVRIGQIIREREYYLGRREYHLAPRAGTRDPGTILGGLGVALVIIGGVLFWRTRSRAALHD